MPTNSREFILQVIEKFRDHECLWKLSHPDYRNKAKKCRALDDLVILFRTKEPSANRETVQKKLERLRGSYNKELRKVRASVARGDENVHVPKLWYYNRMTFLTDQENPPRTSTSLVMNSPRTSTSSVITPEPIFIKEESFDCLDEMESSCSQHSSMSIVPESLKRPRSPEVIVPDRRLEMERASLPALSPEDIIPGRRLDMERAFPPAEQARQPHAIFGEYVAEKLRSLPPGMAPYCQKLINDAIFYAEIGTLNASSRIITDPEG